MSERKAWRENPSVHWAEAFRLMNEGEFEAAIEKLKAAIDIYPEYYDAWLLLGGAQEAAGQIDEAVVSAEEAVVIARVEHSQALSNLAYFHLLLNNVDKAEKTYLEILKIDPGRAGVHYNLACLNAKRGDKAEALEYLKKAIEIEPEYKGVATNDEDLENLRDEIATIG